MTKPNIIFIYADDLGRGMLSCYGQTWFTTPNIDRLADEGITFSRAYGCALCAPARASIITGTHDCHKGRWSYNNAGIYESMHEDNAAYETIRELINNSAYQDREDDVYLPQVAKQAGYVTGQIGKLEWGFATTPERIERHGWDYHFGYYDHQMCHGFYPPFLFENGKRVDIEGNTRTNSGVTPEGDTAENKTIRWNMEGKVHYSQDMFNDKIRAFLNAHKDEPFFLYHPSQLPHGPIAVPDIHPGVRDVDGLSDYEKEYASMVLRLDDTVGIILEELERLDLLDNTIVMFASDNGHEVYYDQRIKQQTLDGTPVDNITQKYYSKECGDIYDGNNGMAGLKRSNLEGGVKVPLIVRMPQQVQHSVTSDALVAGYDIMTTLADIVGATHPKDKDGVSYLPVLHGETQEQGHDYVVYASFEGPGLVSHDNFKLRYVRDTDSFELYDLSNDYQERHNLAAKLPEKTAELAIKLMRECDGSLDNGYIPTHKYDLRDLKKELTGND